MKQKTIFQIGLIIAIISILLSILFYILSLPFFLFLGILPLAFIWTPKRDK